MKCRCTNTLLNLESGPSPGNSVHKPGRLNCRIYFDAIYLEIFFTLENGSRNEYNSSDIRALHLLQLGWTAASAVIARLRTNARQQAPPSEMEGKLPTPRRGAGRGDVMEVASLHQAFRRRAIVRVQIIMAHARSRSPTFMTASSQVVVLHPLD
ncbi:hypothetical protein VTK56DRAFT_9991 [Thermocarpiscus australiensis]